MSAIPDICGLEAGMAKVLGFVAAVLAFGAALAWTAIATGLSTGWVGAAALLGWAVLARRRWERLRATTGTDPCGPERIVWHRLAGTGVLLGHLATALLNPKVDLHLGSGNSLAVDSWTILAAMAVSAMVFRGDAADRDERDAAIDARGQRAGYTALILLLLGLLAWLGFAPRPYQSALTHWVIANLLVALIIASAVVMYAAKLLAYAPDGRPQPGPDA
jgi:hypothetical protein